MSKDEIALHLGVAHEKLRAARELLDEGFVRDAASRAYYAMYHAAYALVREKGHAPKSHAGLASLLVQEWVAPGRISKAQFTAFREAQRVREAGDYDVTFAMDAPLVEAMLDRASSFVSAAEAILG